MVNLNTKKAKDLNFGRFNVYMRNELKDLDEYNKFNYRKIRVNYDEYSYIDYIKRKYGLRSYNNVIRFLLMIFEDIGYRCNECDSRLTPTKELHIYECPKCFEK